MIRLVIMGSSSFGLPSFQALLTNQQCSIVGVMTQPPRPVGRSAVLTPTPVAEWAKKNNLVTYTPARVNDGSFDHTLRQLQPDVCLVVAYGLILPLSLLTIPTHGSINIHGSLLPKYRGASPITAAIMNGEEQTGITYMVMDQGVDTGPTLAQYALPIQPDATTPEVEHRLSLLASTHIIDVLSQWTTGDLAAQPQPTDGASYAPRLSRADGHANWSSAVRMERMVRAYTPWPGLWALWDDRVLKFLQATFLSQSPADPPGTIIKTETPTGWGIACQDGIFVPEIVQLAGKKPQPAAQVLTSYPQLMGTRLS